jgi:RNA polymerase sigma factor (sigma-70 family)
MDAQASFSWNVVTKGFHAHEQIQQRVRQALSKLERHLEHFPADAVHLQVALDKHPKKPLFTAGLVLRVPSNILRGEDKAVDPVPALNGAMKRLLRQLAELKSDLRREVLWKRKGRRAELHAAKARFAPWPLPGGAGPQNVSDLLDGLIEENYDRLLRFVRRQLWHELRQNPGLAGAVDARVVVDEAASQALAAPQRKPAAMAVLPWLYQLARRQLTRSCKALEAQGAETVSLDRRQVLPDESLTEQEPMVERAVVQTVADLMPDGRGDQPDEAAARKDLLGQVQSTANTWPRPEREVFELYFVEGFEPDEIAMVLGVSIKQAEELLASIRARLRTVLLEQAEL